MVRDFPEDKDRKPNEDKEFKNEYVENSIENETIQSEQPPSPVAESYELGREPNGIDPVSIFEKGQSFQEFPEEFHSQRMNRLGKEPNGMDPED
ncbi:hypothetical protein MHZ92_14180 [Sporosarcina sp. ACRSL]|uniref:hypothetical protein n=1 Tax=Sporosarcina sp. ACRSL TaxID=2918215 RepID=UPI001EF465EA|nr:hypothetical protein [Sporosarcina sp. ACRSL]MCG7345286.1 hypothetical protein [Sporosarcina sp. ACRSL]